MSSRGWFEGRDGPMALPWNPISQRHFPQPPDAASLAEKLPLPVGFLGPSAVDTPSAVGIGEGPGCFQGCTYMAFVLLSWWLQSHLENKTIHRVGGESKPSKWWCCEARVSQLGSNWLASKHRRASSQCKNKSNWEAVVSQPNTFFFPVGGSFHLYGSHS